MSHHYKKICKHCGTVISQCICTCEKEIILVVCDKCKKDHKVVVEHCRCIAKACDYHKDGYCTNLAEMERDQCQWTN